MRAFDAGDAPADEPAEPARLLEADARRRAPQRVRRCVGGAPVARRHGRLGQPLVQARHHRMVPNDAADPAQARGVLVLPVPRRSGTTAGSTRCSGRPRCGRSRWRRRAWSRVCRSWTLVPGPGSRPRGSWRVAAPRVTMLDQSPHQLARSAPAPSLEACERVLGDAENLPFARRRVRSLRLGGVDRVLARSVARDRRGLPGDASRTASRW